MDNTAKNNTAKNNTANRRQWLRSVGIGSAGVIASAAGLDTGIVSAQTTPLAGVALPGRKRSLRFAHLTDVHVEPELGANEGMASCLKHVQSHADKPEMILFGGDCVFDSMASDQARTKLQWELWQKVLKDNCSLPVEAGIGNHDVFGWTKSKARTTGQETLYGKAWAMQMLGLSKPYHSFDPAGWHFIVLDSIYPDGDHYKGQLDEDQFQWLSDDLGKTRSPVLIMSHIPIFSVTPMAPPPASVNGVITVTAGSMHGDFQRIKNLFKQHANVKLCLSGHTHLIDRVQYNSVTYLCDGAVSGDWWRGNHLGECDNGYGLIDLYDDGTFDHSYQTYGWKTRAEKTEAMNLRDRGASPALGTA
jgi:3',5'-cyclic AMP phosphodiesterase CpdA